MLVKKVTQVGNPIIRRKSKSVRDALSKGTQKVVKDLCDSMLPHGLIGMAAPQIGKDLRIFVTKVPKDPRRGSEKGDRLRVFINPRVTHRSKKRVYIPEGCGSVGEAGLFAWVRRPETVTVEATGENGRRFKLKAGGLLARVIQHEYDHLEGKVFLDGSFDPKSLMSRNEYFLAVKRALRKLRESKMPRR
ncbi:peptide deformylase [Patescibacteria group bacterium]|nr:peptide deformylase [Patescibacteria group bacterium]